MFMGPGDAETWKVRTPLPLNPWDVVVNDLFPELGCHGIPHVDCNYVYQSWDEEKKLLQGNIIFR